jgi:hypothetical protein
MPYVRASTAMCFFEDAWQGEEGERDMHTDRQTLPGWGGGPSVLVRGTL